MFKLTMRPHAGLWGNTQRSSQALSARELCNVSVFWQSLGKLLNPTKRSLRQALYRLSVSPLPWPICLAMTPLPRPPTVKWVGQV